MKYLIFMGMLSWVFLFDAHAADETQAFTRQVVKPGVVGMPFWTLQASINRAISFAPELRAADFEMAARAGNVSQADAWPNPTLTLRADEKLGLQDGRGGYAVNQVTITQPIPLHRLEHQKAVASAELEAAHASRINRQLMLEARTAQAFHALQLAAERHRVAQERMLFAEKLELRDEQTSKDRAVADRLVRYLSPLERARLEILRATARQDVAQAEGKWSEAMAQFRVLMAMLPDAQPETEPLVPVSQLEALASLMTRLESHPALNESRLMLDASRASVEVARAQRYADPTLSVIHEQDFIGGEKRSYLGLLLGVQIPAWSRGNGNVAKAYGEAGKAEAELEMQRRDLSKRLRQAHLHLGHLVEQAAHYLEHVLQPAHKVLDLTRRGYISGEQNGLALVDASNTYFDAKARYLELLHDAWNEAAELRLAAGISLAGNEQVSRP